jgi:vanillate/3-O-methylgallate O-demethylase
VPSPLPSIYSGTSTQAYRDWLGANSFEAVSTIGGSFVSDAVEDYYFTPWDLDYGRVVKFDHDFIGRAALERMAKGPHRRKVTLVWDADDVAGVFRGMLDCDGLAPKIMEMPAAHFAAYPYDLVLKDGHQVGVSITPAYSANERAWISLAIVDPAHAEIGSELAVVWGEPDGGSRKPGVERHRQVVLRATVQPWPIHQASRESYRKQV